MYSVEIVLDSVSERGDRLTSFALQYPRFIHSEVMTHRAFSRNAASSRAIPIDKMIQRVIDDPAIPLAWGSNKSGMSAGPELVGQYAKSARASWLIARDNAVKAARELQDVGVHKQLVNRVLEPFMFITTLVTATEFTNFFKQRCHGAAQPEFCWLATEMRRKYVNSTPHLRVDGEWHMPFLRLDDAELTHVEKRRVSVARCARVSYLGHDGRRDVSADLDLADKLEMADPAHLSPFEHVATPQRGRHANFDGWSQLRASLENF